MVAKLGLPSADNALYNPSRLIPVRRRSIDVVEVVGGVERCECFRRCAHRVSGSSSRLRCGERVRCRALGSICRHRTAARPTRCAPDDPRDMLTTVDAYPGDASLTEHHAESLPFRQSAAVAVSFTRSSSTARSRNGRPSSPRRCARLAAGP
jgi:hypothetical protein